MNDTTNYLSAPTFVWWDVTRKCNFNCRHCYSRSGQNSSHDELSLKEARQLISELAEAGVFFIYFLGGEPFIRPDFMEIVAFTREQTMGVMINTNGWFINKEVAARLRTLGVYNVRVSLDGAVAESHDRFRNTEGAFSQALTALKNLKESGIPQVSVSSTITILNLAETAAIIDIAAEYGADDIQCLPLSQSGRGGDVYEELGLSATDSAELTRIIENKHNEYRNKMNVYSVDGVFNNPCTQCVQKKGIKPDFMGCRAGRTQCNIDHNGDVIPCLLVRQPVAGNIRQQSFRDIWDDSPVFERWRRKRSDHKECLDCEWNNVCIRECPLSSSQHELTSERRMERVREHQAVLKVSDAVCHLRDCHVRIG